MTKKFEETIKWYDRNAIRYAQATEKNAADYQIKEFCRLLNPGDLVLDAGCGAGRDTKLICEKGIVTIGLDISSGLIQVAKSKYPRIEFVCGNFLNLDFPNNYFDGVWSHVSLVHLETSEECQQALCEFNRVLKNEGILHVLVKEKTDDENVKFLTDDKFLNNGLYRYFTNQEIRNLVNNTGFVILKQENYNEKEKFPDGRPNVNWIRILAQKL